MKKIKDKMILIISSFTLCFLFLFFNSCTAPLMQNTTNENNANSAITSSEVQEENQMNKSVNPHGTGLYELFIEAENPSKYSSVSQITFDTATNASNGKVIHLGGDSSNPAIGVGDYAEYRINFTQSFSNAYLEIRYADNVGGNVIDVSFDGVKKGQFTTDTNCGNDWNTFTWDNELINLGPITAGIHTIRLQIVTGGSWGVKFDELGIYDNTNLDLVNINVTTSTNYACTGYIRAESFSVDNSASVVFQANTDNFNQDYIKLNSGFRIGAGSSFKASIGN